MEEESILLYVCKSSENRIGACDVIRHAKSKGGEKRTSVLMRPFPFIYTREMGEEGEKATESRERERERRRSSLHLASTTTRRREEKERREREREGVVVDQLRCPRGGRRRRRGYTHYSL